MVLPSGELQIRNVSAEDGFKTYKCRTKHRLTGETKLSATAGRLVITGKSDFINIQGENIDMGILYFIANKFYILSLSHAFQIHILISCPK